MTEWPGRRVSTGPALAVRATSPAIPRARDSVERPSNRPAPRTPTLRSQAQDVIRSAPGALSAARERQVYDTTWEDVGRGAQELTGLPSLARGAGGLAALPALARSGFLGADHALPIAGAVAETALGLAGPMSIPRGAARAPAIANFADEPAQRIPNMAREIGPNGMPIAQPQPYRNSLRGGSGDLREAAGMRAEAAQPVAVRPPPPPPAAPNLPSDSARVVLGESTPALTPQITPSPASLPMDEASGALGRRHDGGNAGGRQRAPRRVVDMRTPRGETHETIVNPTEADILRLTQPGRVAAPGLAIERGVPISSSRGVRYIKDADGNVYVGNSYDVTHHDLVTHYGLPNRGSLDGGEIVRLPDGTLELQNNDGAMPLPRGWLSGRTQLPNAGNSPSLPMDEASRMGRAREQGFDVDTPLYHGTTRDFDAFDPAKTRRGPGIWTTTEPRVALEYSGLRNEGANIRPLYGRGNLVPDQRFYDPPESGGFDGNVEAARAAGFDGVQDGTSRIFFDPSNIRSRFAAFDPARSGESDLLAITNDPMADPLLARRDPFAPRVMQPGPPNEDRYLFGRPSPQPTESGSPRPLTPSQISLAEMVDDGSGNLIVGAMRRAGVNISRAEDSGLLDRPMPRRNIPLNQLRRTDHTQPSRQWVDMFRDDPSEFYPIQVRQRGHNRYDIIDGHHRTQAARELGRAQIDAYDASLYFPEVRNPAMVGATALALPLVASRGDPPRSNRRNTRGGLFGRSFDSGGR